MTIQWMTWAKQIFSAVVLSAASVSAAPAGDSILDLQSKWRNQDGQELSLAELKGKPLVVAMVYTSCQGACPLIVEAMKKIEAGLGQARSRVRFVLVSFDTEHDSPSELKRFAQAHALAPGGWTLLAGNLSGVRELSVALEIQFKKTSQKDFAHSNTVLILDPSGRVVHRQTGLGREAKESIRALSELLGS